MAYISPEIIIGEPHNHQTDVWSMGVVLHILLSGVIPFLTDDKVTFKRNIVQGKLRLGHPSFARVSN